MKKRDYPGEWYLPNSLKKYPGLLIVNRKKSLILLEIYGSEFIDGTSAGFNENQNREYFHSIILGDGQTEMTLYNCKWAGTYTISKKFYRVRYQVEILFSRGHVLSEANLFVKGGLFLFPSLGFWYDGQSIIEKLPSMSDNASINLLRENATQEVVNINDNLSLLFFDNYLENSRSLGHSCKIVYRKLLAFKYEKEVSFKQLLDDAAAFKRLLAFVRGKPIHFKIISVDFDVKHIKKDENKFTGSAQYLSLYVTSFSYCKKKNISDEVFNIHEMLFNDRKITKVELNRIISKWFSNKALYNIYDFYNDSNNWNGVLSNVMYNNRFLNLIQALEDYYRDVLEQHLPDIAQFESKKQQVLSHIKNDQVLKQWLNNEFKAAKYIKLKEKIEAIIIKFQALLHQYFGQHIVLTNFPEYAAKIRNELSHGKNKETYQGEQLHVYFHFAQTLLAICIMDTLGVKKIENLIKRYKLLEDNILEVVHSSISA